MSDGVHFILSFASATAPGAVEASRALDLPGLERLLSRLQPVAMDTGDASSLSPPHERALALHAGLPFKDGCVPLAALTQPTVLRAQGCAFITPCHWRVATDHIVMLGPEDLDLSEIHSRAMLDAMRPYFLEDGIAIEYVSPVRWLARSDLFVDFPAASLDRVSGRDIQEWMPRGAKAAALRRLQQEMQMLLYTHAANDERQAAGLAAVNSFWLSGTGPIDASWDAQSLSRIQVVDDLRSAALHADWPTWTRAWQQLDVSGLAALSRRIDEGQPFTLTLCGERSAQRWELPAQGGYLRGFARRVGALVSRPRAAAVLQAL